MGLGLGITLLVIGGILAFGVRDQWSAVDLTAIGYVCLLVGILAIVLSLILNAQRRRTSHTSVVERRDLGPTDPPVL
jgi:membrane protein DedA with SNARE-associated domain